MMEIALPANVSHIQFWPHFSSLPKQLSARVKGRGNIVCFRWTCVTQFFIEQAGSLCHANRTDAGPFPPTSIQWHQENDSDRFSGQLIVGCKQSFCVIPRHPMLGIFSDTRMVFLKCCQIIERIDFSKAAGMDQTHEQIADECSAFSFKEQRIFSMENGPF